MEQEIMEQSRHLVIYSYSNDNREQFLKDMVNNYKVKLNSDQPIGIYLNEFGLPVFDKDNDLYSEVCLTGYSANYFANKVALEIIKKTLKEVKENNLEIDLSPFLRIINFSTGSKKINSLEELEQVLDNANKMYYDNFISFLNFGELDNSFYEYSPINYLSFDNFLKIYKRMLHLNSYLALILDYQKPINIESQKVVNSFIGSRSNADLSIKLVCQPGSWSTSFDINDNIVQSCHDYGVMEIDNSLKEYMKKIK